MNWSDRGLVLGTRAHGESGVILELMTCEHGRHLGLVHGGRSRRTRPVLQPGNTVLAGWRARLDEQLGTYTVEPDVSRAARLMASAPALLGLGTLAAHLRLLPDRDPHPDLFAAAEHVVERLDGPQAAAVIVAAELQILSEFGFGLDLSSCAAGGGPEDLAYVSPRSGRAVGRAPGEPYAARLLALPGFLLPAWDGAPPGAADLAAGFRLTGFFLARHLYEPRGLALPDERSRFAAALAGGSAAPHSGRIGCEAEAGTDSGRGRER